MTDFLSKYRNAKLPNPQSDFVESILNELSSQIYTEWKNKNIFTYVGTSQGHGDGYIIITLNLMSGSNRNQYFYRLIEVEQPIDRAYSVKIRAFQNPPTDWKEIDSAQKFREELVNIMGEPRIQIIIEMVRQMGETIRAWAKEDAEISSRLSEKLDDGLGNKDKLTDV